MATEKMAALTSRGTVLTTELNALANNAYSALGTEIDNGTNLDRFGMCVAFLPTGTAPTVDTTLDLFLVPAADGTNYADGGGAVKPAAAMFVGSFQLRAVATDQRISTPLFPLPPCKFKFSLFNNATGQALDATLNTVTLFTTNRTIN